MNQEILDAISQEPDPEDLIPRQRKPEPKKHYSLEKTHSHIQQVLADMETSFKWSNETLEKDRQRYYALAMGVLKNRGEPSLMSALTWCRDRNVHIRAVHKVLNKSLTPRG